MFISADITSEKKVRVRLKDNDAKYKKIVDNIPYSYFY